MSYREFILRGNILILSILSVGIEGRIAFAEVLDVCGGSRVPNLEDMVSDGPDACKDKETQRSDEGWNRLRNTKSERPQQCDQKVGCKPRPEPSGGGRRVISRR